MLQITFAVSSPLNCKMRRRDAQELLTRFDMAMKEPPQPNTREVLKKALKLPETPLGWVGLGCLILLVLFLALL